MKLFAKSWPFIQNTAIVITTAKSKRVRCGAVSVKSGGNMGTTSMHASLSRTCQFSRVRAAPVGSCQPRLHMM